MPLTATANPSGGPTPGTFTVQISGAQGNVTVTADPSPPNPDPMPDYEITPLSGGDFQVEIKDDVAENTELFFTATDQTQPTPQQDTAAYMST